MSYLCRKVALTLPFKSSIQWDSLKADYQKLLEEPVTDAQFLVWLLDVIANQHELTVVKEEETV